MTQLAMMDRSLPVTYHSSLKIAHITPNIYQPGIGQTVLEIATAQQQAGHSVTVHTVEAHQGKAALRNDLQCYSVPVHICPSWGTEGFAYSPRLLKQVLETQADVIHSHGIWTYASYAAGAAARQLHIPHLCAPHGMLDPWAIQHKALKKRLAEALFQRQVLATSACLHALVSNEAEASRTYGLRSPIATVPIGIDAALLEKPHRREPFEQGFPQVQGQRIVLFLGRIHPKKGLLNLVSAWQMLGAHSDGWCLVIAGPDEIGHEAHVRQAVAHAGLAQQVMFIGPQSGTEVWSCFQAADVFVLPSFSEGFSMAVLEALACGVPVCITPACHFPAVASTDCGVICDPTPDALAAGLCTLLRASDTERQLMGARGRQLVASEYTWAQSGQKLSEVYAWLLDQNLPKPMWVMEGSQQ